VAVHRVESQFGTSPNGSIVSRMVLALVVTLATDARQILVSQSHPLVEFCLRCFDPPSPIILTRLSLHLERFFLPLDLFVRPN
jgi:hypothetical protein